MSDSSSIYQQMSSLFKSSFSLTTTSIFFAILLFAVLTFADAIKSTVDHYIPNTENKILTKFGIGIVVIVIGVIFSSLTR